MQKEVNLYTDGACSGNPGPGGWAAILQYNDFERELSGHADNTTNNRMEMTAIIEGLKILNQPCRVLVHTDSKYVVDAVEKGWAKGWKSRGWIKSDKSPALNSDLWEILLDLLVTHDVRFKWVKGHDGHPMNERCDLLAVKMSRQK